MSITSCSEDMAIYYLEMSGYDLDMAIQLFFSASEDTVYSQQPEPASGGTPKTPMSILFDQKINEAWLVQSLKCVCDISDVAWNQYGIIQPKNGPCGVIAAFLAALISNKSKEGRLTSNSTITDHEIAQSILQILQSCQHDSDGIIRVCLWKDCVNGVGKDIDIIEGHKNDNAGWIMSVLNQYLIPGGALLLALSVVATFGVSNLMTTHSDVVPLVFGNYQFCSSALMNLLLIGMPYDDFNAYDKITGNLLQHVSCVGRTPSPVGFLSGTEAELKMRVGDLYKFPSPQVYVLHSRDHFTTLFVVPHSVRNIKPIHPDTPPYNLYSTDNGLDLNNNSEVLNSNKYSYDFTAVHWNGLPPGGPKVRVVDVIASCGCSHPAPPTSGEGIGREYRGVVNTIDSIIQADPKDKELYPNNWKAWRYEVALVVDDPTDTSERRPDHLPKLREYSLDVNDIGTDRQWRCRACYEVMYGYVHLHAMRVWYLYSIMSLCNLFFDNMII